MNREQRVLAAMLQSRGAYQAIIPFRKQQDFTEQGWLLVEQIDEYYDTDSEAQRVDRGLLKDVIARKYPKSAKIINTVVDNFQEVSVDNVTKEYIELKKEAMKHALADAFLGDEDYSDLLEEFLNADSLEEETEDTTYIAADIEDILADVSGEGLISVHPPALNDRLDGGFVGGHQFAIYAPTEVGKSLLAINISCGFLRDGRKVLYCGNEDPAQSMLLRFYCNLSGMTKEEIIAEPAKAKALAFANGYGNLVFKELTPGSLREIRVLQEKYKPEICIVDQMANMECRSSSKVEKNEILACGLRALAKKNNLVCGIVHQASDDAYGKNILEKNHMYYSNVGVQGQMDVMIGMGMDSGYEQQDNRRLCLTKNKLSGKHDNFPVDVIPELSRVADQ